MGSLTVLGFIAAMAVLLFLVLRLARNYFLGAYKRHDEKLAEDYRKAVEKHQLSDMKMSTYPDPPKRKYDRVKVVDKSKDFHANKFSVRNGLANDLPKRKAYSPPSDRKVIYQTTTNDVNTNSVPASLVDPNSSLWGTDISSDTAPTHSTFSGESFGHGGDFGGGGASGSWGSDDSSSSSYSDSSSDSGGSDSSSSD